jgi:hypothetical protein
MSSNTSFSANALTVANGKVFVAAGHQGLVILHEYQPIRLAQITRQNNGAMHLRIWTDWLPVTFTESPLEIFDSDATSQPVGFYRLAVP